MKRWTKRVLAALAVLAAAGALATVLVLRSEWFRVRLHHRIVALIEDAVGGRVEIEAFDFDWSTLTARATGARLHGTEAPGRAPFVTVRSLAIALRVDSWLRRDIHLRRVTADGPSIHIYVNPDGTTNIPAPNRPPAPTTIIEDLIGVRVGELAIRNAEFEYDSRKAGFSTTVTGLSLDLAYDRSQPRMRFVLGADRVDLPERFAPALQASGWMEPKRLLIEQAVLRQGDSVLRAAARLEDYRTPSIQGTFQADALLAQIPPSPFRTGRARAQGSFAFPSSGLFLLEGAVSAEGVSLRDGPIFVENGRIKSSFRIEPDRVTARDAEVDSSFGAWKGSVELRSGRDWTAKGAVDGLRVEKMQPLILDAPYPWRGLATGPALVAGSIIHGRVTPLAVDADLRLTPADGEIPIQGAVGFSWTRASGRVEFRPSYAEIQGSRMDFHGTLGERVEVDLRSEHIGGLEPAVALFARQSSFSFPVGLRNGAGHVVATVRGPIGDPAIRGRVSLSKTVYEEIVVKSLDASVRLDPGRLDVDDFTAQFSEATVGGKLSLPLKDWDLDEYGAISAQLRLTRVNLAEASRLLGVPPPAGGVVRGTVEISGSPAHPSAAFDARLQDAVFGPERFHQIEARLSLDGASGRLAGDAELDRGKLQLSGRYLHQPSRYQEGELELRVRASGFSLGDIESLQQIRPGLGGTAAGDLQARLTAAGGSVTLRALEGTLTAPAVTIGSRALGAFRFEASTSGEALRTSAQFDLPDGPLKADASLRLSGDFPAEGRVTIPRIRSTLLHDLVSPGREPEKAEQWPVRGSVSAQVAWRAPLADPGKYSARLTIDQLTVLPREEIAKELQIEPGNRVLRNSGPLIIDVDAAAVRLRQVRLTALDTNLTATGQIGLADRGIWNLEVRGAADMAVLSTFEPDLVASGTASLDLAVRGLLADPQLSGRMQIENGSFFLRNLPNGVEKANGTIYFEGNRANIEKFTGQTGGGDFQLTGFIGVNRNLLLYRLQAQATNIRVRYPEGVSTTADLSLSLSGSPARSLLAGYINVRRAGLQASGDLASAVGSSGNPIPTAASSNEFLRNLQFDVRIRSMPDAVIQSTYTQDLQTEADLRLRGTPSKPVLLGSVKVSQGAVSFFGNRYTVSRGEITFFNTAVVQPIIDLDLETRVRGVTVYINLSGPLSRLNTSYRSDPPLQSGEILALLTVGRTPASTSTAIPATPDIRSQTVLETNSSNALLGAALSNVVSGRMERFFGATRMKIDPQVTGMENVNQARLSIEQSLSRDITLTFITNLGRTQQQIVRVEWDLSRQWQAVAVRDENGVLAVDFVYRKRFK